LAGYEYLSSSEGPSSEVSQLQEKIRYFNSELKNKGLSAYFLPSISAIHCCIVPGNDRVKKLSEQLFEKEFDVKPILSPTVPQGKERLRICLHSYNTTAEIDGLLKEIANFME
jgi:8-amino-7-oxononanoate synthase